MSNGELESCRIPGDRHTTKESWLEATYLEPQPGSLILEASFWKPHTRSLILEASHLKRNNSSLLLEASTWKPQPRSKINKDKIALPNKQDDKKNATQTISHNKICDARLGVYSLQATYLKPQSGSLNLEASLQAQPGNLIREASTWKPHTWSLNQEASRLKHNLEASYLKPQP